LTEQGYKPRFTVAVTGDSLLTTQVSCYKEPDFLAVFDIIKKQTMGFTNLEVLLNDLKGIPAADSGGCGAATTLVEDIKWMGFQVVSRANNHALDYSYEGLRLTSETLDKAGVCHAGVGENLGEARSPAYLETPAGRVAILSASSLFPAWGRAGHVRPDFRGRPGLSPLRYSTYFNVSKEYLQALKAVEETLGLTKLKENARKSGYLEPEKEGELSFSGLKFVASDTPGLHTDPNEKDVQEIVKWIKDAKRQADWVFYSLHAHQGKHEVPGMLLNREVPAEFIEKFARTCIDAGADAFIGHGSHILWGIEVYKGKPIFYSLGNFIFQNALIKKQSQERYDGAGLGLEATPADLQDANSKNRGYGAGLGAFTANVVYWESVLGIVDFDNGALKKVELYPLYLGWDRPRSQRGRPTLAKGEIAARILERMQKLSEPYGTKIRLEGERGVIEL
jgi:poly-gamma-glutamate synthesis protein (capsule biosynthesis protein)